MDDRAEDRAGAPRAERTPEGPAGLRHALFVAVAAGACSIPFHELGHWVVGFLFELPDLRFRGDAVSHSATLDTHGRVPLAALSLAGPGATLLLALGAWVAERLHPSRAARAVLVVASIRPLGQFVRYAVVVAGGSDPQRLCDETVAAARLGWPSGVWIVVGAVVAAGLLATSRPKGALPVSLVALVGGALGIALWVGAIVPAIWG